jgi:cell wall-associated NlpC family hydrolase
MGLRLRHPRADDEPMSFGDPKSSSISSRARRRRRQSRISPRTAIHGVLFSTVIVAGVLACPSIGAAASTTSRTTNSVYGCVTTLGASPSGLGSSSSAPVTSAEVSSIEATISSEELCITNLSEQYDETTYRLQQIDSKLTASSAQIRADDSLVASTRKVMRAAIINQYMADAPAQRLATLFSGLSESSMLQSAYTNDAVGNISLDLQQEQSATKELRQTRQQLRTEQSQAQTETRDAHKAELEATAETNANEKLLAQIKGKLAKQVAAQAALKAKQEAAAVQAAATLRIKQQDALQAEEDAQLAQTLGNSSGNSSAGQAASGAGEGTSKPPTHPTTDSAGMRALKAAESYLGVPYAWGGASRAGVDCSGLTMLSWQAAGVSLAHSAAIQEQESTPVPLDQLQPGDLLFYDFGGDGIDHVVMYVGSGSYGVDTIIQAAHSGTVVSFDALWYQGLVGAGRP